MTATTTKLILTSNFNVNEANTHTDAQWIERCGRQRVFLLLPICHSTDHMVQLRPQALLKQLVGSAKKCIFISVSASHLRWQCIICTNINVIMRPFPERSFLFLPLFWLALNLNEFDCCGSPVAQVHLLAVSPWVQVVKWLTGRLRTQRDGSRKFAHFLDWKKTHKIKSLFIVTTVGGSFNRGGVQRGRRCRRGVGRWLFHDAW